MTTKEIQEINTKFQEQAVQLSELFPSGGLTNATSIVIRSCKKADLLFTKLLATKSEMQFNTVIAKLEEECDEILFVMDQLEMATKKQNIDQINDFLRDGYSLVSLYSKCCDFIIEKKALKED